MTYLLGFLLFVALGGLLYFLVLWFKERRAARRLRDETESKRAAAEQRQQLLESELGQLRAQAARLSKWSAVEDADTKAREILSFAQTTLAQAESDARILLTGTEEQCREKLDAARLEAANDTAEAKIRAKKLTDEAQAALATATVRATQIIAEANERAEQIAGKAYDAVRNAELYERTARAMRNIIEGYGDEYLVPAESLLDDLAEEFGHKDAGQQLRLARDHVKALIKSGDASRCEYVEANRKEGAERFVLDAFNGKVDSILSRVRHDNYGTLEEEIRDAVSVVNFGGKAFRDARITDEYLNARLQELKWATIAQELKKQEQEEQRRAREQIREEERARKEYERALREAAKEEDAVQKAVAKVQAQLAAATDEQKAKYEGQLAELQLRLRIAEDKGQRAISMAQQTKRGHVYIISNVGSFGENVFKVGLTRRLEPLDRIRELGDASVPFEFDVHAMILSDDAPALELQLHKHFLLNQINKVNHRKEFFRALLGDIRREIESLGIEAKWTMTAEATQYRETLAIERAIQSDPAAREAWINRQLTLDPVSPAELVGIAEDEE